MEQGTKPRFRGTYLLYVRVAGDLARYRGAIPVQLPLQDPHAGGLKQKAVKESRVAEYYHSQYFRRLL